MGEPLYEMLPTEAFAKAYVVPFSPSDEVKLSSAERPIPNKSSRLSAIVAPPSLSVSTSPFKISSSEKPESDEVSARTSASDEPPSEDTQFSNLEMSCEKSFILTLSAKSEE